MTARVKVVAYYVMVVACSGLGCCILGLGFVNARVVLWLVPLRVGLGLLRVCERINGRYRVSNNMSYTQNPYSWCHQVPQQTL